MTARRSRLIYVFVVTALLATPLTGIVGPPNAATAETSSSSDQSLGTLVDSTRTTDTYQTPDGTLTTLAYPGSINYKDSSGDFQPIDDSLVPVPGPDPDVENAANRYDVQLPPNVSDPVQLSRPAGSVTLAVLGASASRVVDGDTASYPDAMPGVTVAYTSQADQVKETLTLADASASTSFDYRLTVSAGLTPQATDSGGIDVVNGSGALVYSIAPPFMTDSSGNLAELLGSVPMTLSHDASGWLVSMAADQTWLSDPARVWPVVIDPTITVAGATQDCYYQSGTSGASQSCVSSDLNVGVNSNGIRRAMLKFSLSSIPAGSTVTSAALGLTLTAENKTTQSIAVETDNVTKAWTTGVTWTTYDGTNAWTTAGGDFTTPTTSLASVGGNVTMPIAYSFDLTQLVQGWVGGTITNNGVLLRQTADTTATSGNILSFASTDSTTSSQWPTLSISYQPPSPPGGTLTTPENDSSVSGTVQLTAQPAGSNVKEVDFYAAYLGTRLLVGSDTNGLDGWSANLDTTGLPDGRVDLSAQFVDTAGDVNCCAVGSSVAVVVNNSTPAPSPWQFIYDDLGIKITQNSDLRVGLNNGSLLLAIENGIVPGVGPPAGFGQVYNSGAKTRGELGAGWRASTEDTLTLGTDGSITRWDSEGHQYTFVPETSSGLSTQYWNNTTLSGNPALTRTDSQMNFTWGTGSPDPSVNPDNFSARWSGFVTVPSAGTWTFYASTEDGVRLWVDGQPVIDDWQTQAQTESSGSIYLSSGRHQFKAEYFAGLGSAAAVLSFAGPGTGKQVIAASDLTQSTGVFDAPAGVHDSLSQSADGSYQLLMLNQTKIHYTAAGLEDSITDRDGNQLSVGYNLSSQPTYLCQSGSTCSSQNAKVTISYDSQGRIIQVSDADSRTWSYQYDATGRLNKIIDPRGWADAVFAYDSSGRLNSVTDSNGGVTRAAYDQSGRVSSVKDPQAVAGNGPATTFSYDTPSLGNVTVRKPDANASSPPGPGAIFTLGAAGQLLSKTDEIGHSWSFTYDGSFDMLSETDPAGDQASWTHDGHGNVLTATDSRGAVTRYTYDGQSDVLSVTDPLANQTSYTYDAAGDMLSTTDPQAKTMNFSVNALGELASDTDPLGNQTSYTYDAAGNAATVTDPAGGISRFSYDPAGNVVSSTDPLGNTTSYTYDASGNVLSVTDAAGDKTTYSYNNLGAQTSVVDPVGNQPGTDPSTRQLTTSYDGMDRPISVTQPSGGGGTTTTQTAYNWDGNPVTQTDPMGNTISLTYDAAGRLVSETTATGATTSYSYNALDQPVSETGPSGTTQYAYDSQGHLTSVIDPLGNKTTYAYDLAGNLTSQISPGGNVSGAAPGSYKTSFSYDSSGRMTGETEPLGRNVSYGYDSAGNMTSSTDPVGMTVTSGFDSLGRPTSGQRPGSTSQSTSGSVDAVTNPRISVGVTVSNAGLLQAALFWDAQTADLDLKLVDSSGTVIAQSVTANRPEALTARVVPGQYTLKIKAAAGGSTWRLDYGLPGPLTSQAGYNADGQLSSTSNSAGTISYSYDAAGNLSSVSMPGPVTYSYSHDADGVLTRMTDPTGTQSFSLDTQERLSQATDQSGTQTTYSYDANSNESAVTRAGSTFSYSYDGEGRVTQRSSGTSTATFGYTDQVNPTDITFPTGETDHRTFDGDGRVTSVTLRPQSGASPELARGYAYDAEGNLTQVTDSIASPPTMLASYQYDQADRLTQETNVVGGQTTSTSYSYDADGNRLTLTTASGVTSYTYNDGGQLVARTDPSAAKTTYFYDGNGNLVRTVGPSGATAYVWSPDGRLTSETLADGTNLTFAYDAGGLRVSKSVSGSTTTYSYDKGRLSSIAAPNGTAQLSYDPQGTPLTITWQGVTYNIRTDEQGSVIELTDTRSHTAAVTYRYDAWGNIIQSTGPASLAAVNPYTWLGTLQIVRDSETGLYMMGSRYYDPATGRFISEDPAESESDVGPYAYADDNPLVKADPTGLETILVPGQLDGSPYTLPCAIQPPGSCNGAPNFRSRVQWWLHYKGATYLETFVPFRWSRQGYDYLPDLVQHRVPLWWFSLTVVARANCAWLHPAGYKCNLIGHSAGALMAMHTAGRGVGTDFLMTMAAIYPYALLIRPKNDVFYTGSWFHQSLVHPTPRLWYNLMARKEWLLDRSSYAINIGTYISHGDMWNAPLSARLAATGICAVRVTNIVKNTCS